MKVIISIILCVIIVLIFYYFNTQKIETFQNSGKLEKFDPHIKPIDAISLIPDRMNNPRKFVLVILLDNMVWKFDLSGKRMDDLNEREQQSLGLKLKEGYPITIEKEFAPDDSIFHNSINSIYTDKDNIYLVRNQFQYDINSKKTKYVAKGHDIFTNQNSYTPDDGLDGALSVNYKYTGWGGNINYFPNIATDNDIYIHRLYLMSGKNQYYPPKSNGGVSMASSLSKSNGFLGSDNDNLVTNQSYYDFKIHQNRQYNKVLTNNLLNVYIQYFVSTDNWVSAYQKVDNCLLWHHIRRKPNCCFVYPLHNFRQNQGSLFVISKDLIWKYKILPAKAKHLVALYENYPKKINTEFPNLPSNYKSHFDAVWSQHKYLMFVKGNVVVQYNMDDKKTETVLRLKDLGSGANSLSDIANTGFDAVLQVPVALKEDDSNKFKDSGDISAIAGSHLYFYTGTNYTKFAVSPTTYTKLENNKPIGNNIPYADPNNYLVSSWYHPVRKTNVYTNRDNTYLKDDTTALNNNQIYHCHSKTVILSDIVKKAYLLVNIDNNQNIITQGMKFDNGKLISIPADSTGENNWTDIVKILKQKRLNEICGMCHSEAFQKNSYIFTNDKYLRFNGDGNYVGYDYMFKHWTNSYTVSYNGNTWSSWQKKQVPSRFDFCFSTGKKHTFFFKSGTCYRFRNENAYKFGSFDIRSYDAMFRGLDNDVTNGFYDPTKKEIYFIKGNQYIKYKYDERLSATSSGLKDTLSE